MEPQEKNTAKPQWLNDSWVELNLHQSLPAVQLNTQMEKLLLEAQRDSLSRSSRASSVNASIASSRASPKGAHSPTNELNMDDSLPPFIAPFTDIPEVARGTDWIWDWSSRPEVLPPNEWGSRFKHPKRNPLSVRNTRVMSSGPFKMENLPKLLFTHACTFLMGAAVMFIYLKKYCQLSVITVD